MTPSYDYIHDHKYPCSASAHTAIDDTRHLAKEVANIHTGIL